MVKEVNDPVRIRLNPEGWWLEDSRRANPNELYRLRLEPDGGQREEGQTIGSFHVQASDEENCIDYYS